MTEKGLNIEDEFRRKFTERNLKYLTKEKSYKVRLKRPLMSKRLPFDFSILIGETTIGIIEIKSPAFLKRFDFSSMEDYASKNDLRFFVVSDGERFILTDRNKGYIKQSVLFNEFTKLITESKDVDMYELSQIVAKHIKQIISNSAFSSLKNQFDDLYKSILNELNYDEINQRFFFGNWDDINNIENRLFRLLLQDEKPIRKVYRYTSLDTIFSSLKHNTYRLNCLVGMNDTSEVNYAENKVLDKNRDYANANWKRIDSFNKRFISSCSLKKDDLTQWRLYGDDSKGVCLELKVNEEGLNSDFILKRISYARKGGRHPELDLLKKIRTSLYNEYDIIFDFKTLSTWKHFFKPYDYSVEKEVRLLYVQNDDTKERGWVVTNSHQILNPYVEFNLNEATFPLNLKRIVLGPKCPEMGINKKQFQAYIRQLKVEPNYNLRDVKVANSSIDNYR